ncbi:MAG: DEAD/DEAH box helicase [Gallionella sp.]
MFRSKEQSKCAALLAKHLRLADAPLLLEGGTGIGKTRAYLSALMQSGRRVAIVLPTHQLIEQLLASSDLAHTRGKLSIAAFRPARMFDVRADYERNKVAAMAAQVMLCTAASVIIDQRLSGEYNGATTRDYLLFDEADQLPDMAALQSDFTISVVTLAALNIRLLSPTQALQAILAKPARSVEPETRAAARIILDALEEPAWYQSAGLNDAGDIVLTHRLPGRLLKNISNRPQVAFVSATLTVGGQFNDFQRSMGIEKISVLSDAIEPEQHGKLDFEHRCLEVDTPAWFAAVLQTARDAAKPVLIATTSHELSQQLGEQLVGSVVRGVTETAAQAALRVPADGIFIAAGAWAGLDTPLRWRSIVVPRVPYSQPVVIDGETLSRYFDAKNTAVRRLRQVIGRGLRNPDAICSVIILDERASKLNGFVPERFAAAWHNRRTLLESFSEGERLEVVLSKSERDPAVRRHALKHYGCKCMACEQVFIAELLDVHHKDPIADGVRKTKLDDLMVLCANCHRLEHVRLRALARTENNSQPLTQRD